MKLKNPIIILASVFISACSYTTNPVTEIGARVGYTTVATADIKEVTEISLKYEELHKESDDIFDSTNSYSIYSPMRPRDWLTRKTALFDYNKIVWKDAQNGYIDLNVEGDIVRFDINKYENSFRDYHDQSYREFGSPSHEYIKISHQYRTWYGYLAQVLLLATIPIDLVINVILLPFTIFLNIMF